MMVLVTYDVTTTERDGATRLRRVAKAVATSVSVSSSRSSRSRSTRRSGHCWPGWKPSSIRTTTACATIHRLFLRHCTPR
jgi:hypothetical protein